MNLNRNELLSQLRQMDEYEFERLVADVWEKRGWDTTVTTGSSDRGIDVIAEKNSPFNQKYVIQAKRYAAGNKIGGPDIRNYEALKRQEDSVDVVVIVTTSSFSSQAHQIADDLNVKLIDGEDLCDTILDLNSQDFLADYFRDGTANRTSRSTTSQQDKTASNNKKAGRDANSYPWENLSSVEASRNHDYFSHCPICESRNAIWYAEVGDEQKLRCEDCDMAWKKVGLISKKWLLYRGDKKGEKKTTKGWKKEISHHSPTAKTSKTKDTSSANHDLSADDSNIYKIEGSTDKFGQVCPICGSEHRLRRATTVTDDSIITCLDCDTQWEEVGLITTKWKNRQEGSKKSASKWKRMAPDEEG